MFFLIIPLLENQNNTTKYDEMILNYVNLYKIYKKCIIINISLTDIYIYIY